MLGFLYVYNKRWIKKNVYMLDEGLEYFLYSDFDCPAENNPDRKDTYLKLDEGRRYISGSGKRNMKPEFVEKLDKVAARFYKETGIKLWERVISGYRTKEHNKAVGGVADSSHLEGWAADFNTVGISKENLELLFDMLNDEGIERIGEYGKGTTSIHVDLDPTKEVAQW